MELRKDIKQWSSIGVVNDKPFSGNKLPINKEVIERFLYYLKVKKYTVKQTMIESYDEVIAVWRKNADGATSSYTGYMSRKIVLKRLNDLYEMLKRAEDPKSDRSHREKWHLCVDKLFDISKNDIKDHLCKEDFEFIQDQKGPRQPTFGGKDIS